MSTRRGALCAALLLTCSAANAESQSFASKVASLNAQGDGSAILTFATPVPGCSDADQRFTLPRGDTAQAGRAFRQMYKLALSAGLSQSPVVVFFDNATAPCTINNIAVSF
ncbi:hypothetical protein [Pseudomonas indica]|uniref:hypothetical protein n=1 Tax=Pseudomonas indica TaxID=137658 RepID=UPI000BABE3EE|nr:hypothetical protein [Pseudomonas indica]PAU65802.1 hypothetical protein BZL42_00015 [Pseudomonas indica]